MDALGARGGSLASISGKATPASRTFLTAANLVLFIRGWTFGSDWELQLEK